MKRPCPCSGTLPLPVRAGDLLIRSAPAQGVRYVSLVASENAESPVSLSRRGLPVEIAGPGLYVEVVETPVGGGPSRHVGRRLTDACGRVPPGQVVLRLSSRGVPGDLAALTEAVDVARAVRMNGLAASWLRWEAHRDAITRLVGPTPPVDDGAFATAVGAWQVAHGLRKDGVVGPCTLSAMRPALGIGPVVPCVTVVRFRNAGGTDPDNCCTICPVNLGVGVDRGAGPTASNGMELRFTLRGHAAGFEYDITRTRRISIFQRVGGAWARLRHDPSGTGDDTLGNHDECLTPTAGGRIFAEDRPGWNQVLPLPPGTILLADGGVPTDPAASDIVLRASFVEWVITRNSGAAIGWTRISMPISWNTITWLVRDALGGYVLDPRSRIARGSISPAAIAAAPA